MKPLSEIKPVSLRVVFPTLSFKRIVAPDMSITGAFFEKDPDHEDLSSAAKRLEQFQKENPGALLANGYLEQRAFYTTSAYQRTINGKTEHRNIHLGTDFWIPAGTPVHAPLDGKVVISHNNDFHKDYGPTIVLKHKLERVTIHTLFGHLSRASLRMSEVNRELTQGEQIGCIGDKNENGHWLPHLHFQIITDLLGNTENYNGVAFPSELDTWMALCPNPDLLFKEHLPCARL